MMIAEVFNTPYKLSTKHLTTLAMQVFGCIKPVEIVC